METKKLVVTRDVRIDEDAVWDLTKEELLVHEDNARLDDEEEETNDNDNEENEDDEEDTLETIGAELEMVLEEKGHYPKYMKGAMLL